MSRHEGVSCDSCMKGNFRGRRYKCLICYDYDLCAACYEAGATTTRHTVDHPMQCILTRSDFDLYYGGEGLTIEQPQAFTCPYCGKMGFTETALQEHVASDHSETSFEVVCPVCAALPGGEPNLVTDDFAGHLTLEHRTGPRDLISFLDEPTSSRHATGVRRIPHPTTRGVSGPRSRRSNMHFSSSGGGLSSLSPSARDSVDPIAELLSQLSGVRRTAAAAAGNTPSQLQQLQMQLQLERTQVRAARQQLERLPRRAAAGTGAAGTGTATGTAGVASATPAQSAQSAEQAAASPAVAHSSQLMLTRCLETSPSDVERESAERSRADRSLFVQELLLTTLTVSDDVDTSRDQTPETRSASAYVGSSAAARDFPATGAASVESRRTATRGRPPAQPRPPQPQQPRPPHHPGTGTVREVPAVPAPVAYHGGAAAPNPRRKPVRPVPQASEPPPPSH